MKAGALVFILVATIFLSFRSKTDSRPSGSEERFDVQKDLLLAQFDCKTDVDDLHSAAALVTLLSNPKYSKIKFHAVAGTYGIQEDYTFLLTTYSNLHSATTGPTRTRMWNLPSNKYK
jgi:hypothetical protein